MLLRLFFALTAFAAERPAVFQLPAEPDTLDPVHVSDVIGFNIVSNVNEGLVRLNGAGKLVNGLAEKYWISKDQRIYRFRLKANAKWSDGKLVTIEDFIFGLKRTLDPKTAARDASFIQGIKEIRKEKNELVIELKVPGTAFLQALTMPMAGPAREDLLSKQNGTWQSTNPSTGPYVIAFFKPDREIRLEPNPFYKGAKLPIIFKVVPEEATALNLFETGKLDGISSIPTTELARLAEKKFLKISPSSASFYLAFNLTKPPFTNIRWRKALAAAVNRENLARLSPETIRVTHNYIPSAVEGAGAQLHPDFSADLAWAKQQAKPEFALVYPATALATMLTQRMQNDIGKELGSAPKLEPMEWKAYLGRLQGEAPALFYMGYSAPFNDAESHLKLFLADESDNRSHYSNPAYASLVAKIKKLPNGKARAQAIEAAQRLLVEKDVVVIPLLERQQVHAIRPELQGFIVNPYGVVEMRSLHW